MKVAVLADGNSIHTVKWINGLAKNGVDVVLITSHSVSTDIDVSVNVHKLPFSSDVKMLSGTLAHLFNVLPLMLFLLRLRPEILHAHYLSGYGLLGALTFFKGFMASVWGSDIYIFPTRSRTKKYIIQFVLYRAKYLTSTSQDMLSEVMKYRDVSKKSCVIPFGVDTDKFHNTSGRKYDQFVMGTVKGLRDVYGIDYLINAFNIVCEHFENTNAQMFSKLRLIIAGKGEKEAELKELALQSNYSDKISFLGFVDNNLVPEVLSGLDLFVAYSRSESFGVSVLEASSFELPVIVSDVGGLPEVVQDHRTGLIVQAYSEVYLASAIIELVTDPELMKKMSRNGRSFVIKRYSEQASIGLMMDLYQEIFDEKE